MNSRSEAGRDRASFIAWLDRSEFAQETGIRSNLMKFADLIGEENRRLGLVSPRDLPRLLTRHFQECLAPGLLDLARSRSRLLDAGSGAGLPGLPLAIALPLLQVGLIEPRQRRVGFLERAILALGLRNARVIPGTLQEAARSGRVEPADLLTSRALRWTPGMLQALAELLVPEGVVARFGSPGVALDGVATLPVGVGGQRVLQVWPRAAWRDLPAAP